MPADWLCPKCGEELRFWDELHRCPDADANAPVDHAR